MLLVLATIIGFGLGFLAGRIDRGDRRQDRLSARRVADICGLDRHDTARLRQAGVL